MPAVQMTLMILLEFLDPAMPETLCPPLDISVVFFCISLFEFDYCHLGMNLRVVTSCEGKSKNKHTSQSFRRNTRIPLRRFSHCTKNSLLIFYRS